MVIYGGGPRASLSPQAPFRLLNQTDPGATSSQPMKSFHPINQINQARRQTVVPWLGPAIATKRSTRRDSWGRSVIILRASTTPKEWAMISTLAAPVYSTTASTKSATSGTFICASVTHCEGGDRSFVE